MADKFYNDFLLLNLWDSNKVFFVVRHKGNIRFKSIQENELPEKMHAHLLNPDYVLEYRSEA